MTVDLLLGLQWGDEGKGTVHLLSRVIASPELDDEEKLKTN